MCRVAFLLILLAGEQSPQIGPYEGPIELPANVATEQPTLFAEYKTIIQLANGNALMLLVQDNCEPCRRLERNLLSTMQDASLVMPVYVFSVQDEPQLVRRLMGSEMNRRRGYPQIIVFRFVDGKHYRWQCAGYGSRSEVATISPSGRTGTSTLTAWLKSIRGWRAKETTRTVSAREVPRRVSVFGTLRGG